MKTVAMLVRWVFCHKPTDTPELSYWEGCLGPRAVARVYELGNKDWLISAVGPQFHHSGLSLFHVPYETALLEAERLVADLWN